MIHNKINQVVDFLTDRVRSAPAVALPFSHLELDRVFPDRLYAEMVAAMPMTPQFRPMSGGAKATRADGIPTRVKIDLFADQIWHLPKSQRDIWGLVGACLRSQRLQSAFVDRLAPELEYRFGQPAARIRLYPVPSLTRDVPGYSLDEHPDTSSKGITVQFYLPRDDSISNIGTVFHKILSDGRRERSVQMKFLPNTGYAFAVGRNTWHSVDRVGDEIETRDSILLTYFVDSGHQLVLNRLKRAGNFLRNSLRHVRRSNDDR